MPTDQERREHSRRIVAIEVKITEPDIGSVTLYTRDVSMGGAFVKIPPDHGLAVGEIVAVEFSRTPWSEGPATFSARVVRVTDDGVGLQFVDFEAS